MLVPSSSGSGYRGGSTSSNGPKSSRRSASLRWISSRKANGDSPRQSRWPRSAVGNATCAPIQVTWSDELYRLFGLANTRGRDHLPASFWTSCCRKTAIKIRSLADEAIGQRGLSTAITASARRRQRACLNDRGIIILEREVKPIRLVGTAQDVTDCVERNNQRKNTRSGSRLCRGDCSKLQEAERRHLARELHDEFGQVLATVTLHLHAARSLAGAAALPHWTNAPDSCSKPGTGPQPGPGTAAGHARHASAWKRPCAGSPSSTNSGPAVMCRWSAICPGRHSPPNLCYRLLSRGPGSPDECCPARRGTRTSGSRLKPADSVLELVVRDDGMGFDVASTQEQAAARQPRSAGNEGTHPDSRRHSECGIRTGAWRRYPCFLSLERRLRWTDRASYVTAMIAIRCVLPAFPWFFPP